MRMLIVSESNQNDKNVAESYNQQRDVGRWNDGRNSDKILKIFPLYYSQSPLQLEISISLNWRNL
jgi:hypothetical protein